MPSQVPGFVPATEVRSAPQAIPSASKVAAAENKPNEGYKGSALDFTVDVIEADFIQSGLKRAFAFSGYPLDENFQLPRPDSPEGKEFWEGIEPADRSWFFEARSLEHFHKLRDEYNEVRAAEERLNDASGAGVAARLALNVADPVGLLMAAGTGRLELLARGSRLARAAKIGLLNAGANAAGEGVVVATNPKRSSTDVLMAAAFGFTLGGAAGALGRENIAKANRVMDDVGRRARAEEIVEAAKLDGTVLTVDEVHTTLKEIEVPVLKPKRSTETASQEPATEPAKAPATAPTPAAVPAPRRVNITVPAEFRKMLAETEGLEAPSSARDRLMKTIDETDGDEIELDQDVYDYLGSRLAGYAEKATDTVVRRAITRLSDEHVEDVGMRKIMSDTKTYTPTNQDEMVTAAFGGDSAGAAKATSAKDVRNTEDLEIAHAGKVDRPAFVKAQVWSYNAVLRGASDDVVRSTLGLLVGDGVGTASGKASPIGASEEASKLHKHFSARLVQMDNEAMDSWLKDSGKSWLSSFSPRLRDEFMSQVGRAMMGITGNYPKQVKQLAAQKRALLDEIGDELVRRGIIDEKVDQYGLPRFWNHEAVEAANIRYHTEQLEELFTEAVRRDFVGQSILNSGLDPVRAEEIVEKLGKGFLRRIREVGRGIDVEMMHGVSLQDTKYLDELLEQGGASDDLRKFVGDNFDWMLKQKNKDDAGKPAFGKHRMKLDMDFGLRLTVKDVNAASGQQYTQELVRIGDLVENNAEVVMHKYTRSTTGRIALAKVMDVKNDGEFSSLVNAAKSRLSDEAERNRVVSYAQDAYHALVGRPLDANPASGWARISRAMRNLNMARVGSSFGLAQIADLANVTAIGGLREMLGGVASFRSFFARAANGRLENGLLRDLEEFASLGLDHQSTSLFAHEYDELFTSRLSRVEFGLRAASRAAAVGSGMTVINRWSQMLAGQMIVNKIARGSMNAKRLAYLGLDQADAAAITAALKQHGKAKNGRVVEMNLSQWPDMLLRDKFTNAVRKAATRAVQENDFGSTFPFMHRELGKMLSQFRSFVLVSWSKQTLHLAHMRDIEAFQNVAWGLFFGPLSYASYVMTSKPQEEWGDKLTLGKIASAAFTRTGFGSMIPTLVDTPLTAFGFDPLLGHTRSTGLSTNALAGVPTIDFVDRLQKGASSIVQSAWDEDRDFTTKDADNLWRLMILQNFWTVPWIKGATLDALDLPEDNK